MSDQPQLLATRFGEIEFEESDVLTFPEGLIGLPDLKRFVVLNVKEDSPFRWLQSVEEGAFALVVTNPSEFVSGYEPEVAPSAVELVELQEDTPRLVYTVVTIPSGDPKRMTLNLAGPILVNLEKSIARQLVLDSDQFPIKFRVYPEESQAA
jgi:flagellar assembly factor FliW